jgi:Kef-type K+ transport system membrane component KefB
MPALQILLLIAIIILVAKLSGLVISRIGQPAVLGELLAGLILGPTLLDMFHWPIFAGAHLEETVFHLAELGVIFLMFIAGLEVDLESMLQVDRAAVFAGVLGVIVPLLLSAGTGLLFGFDLTRSVFLGIILAATSVSISAQTLMELGVLRSREGLTLLGAAIIDDLLVILVLSLFVALTAGGAVSLAVLGWIVARMVLFLIAAVAVGAWLLPRAARWVGEQPISEGVLAFAVVVTLTAAWAAEALGGIATITGAFLAGVFFRRTYLYHTIEEGVHKLTYAFLVPIFFVSIGLEADARALGLDLLPFVLVILVVAVLSKIGGSGLGALLGGFDRRQALRTGIGMVSRGEVGLIVATVGVTQGLISDEIFSVVVIVVLVTTLATPLMLRSTFTQEEEV